MLRVEEALVRLPVTAAAFERGSLTSSHVRLLARVASPEAESFWVALAQRTSVRDLAAAVARSIDESGGGPNSHPSVSAGLEEEPPPERLDIEAPAWMAALWRDTVALVRNLVEYEASQGQCLEVVLAEYQSGTGSANSIEVGDAAPPAVESRPSSCSVAAGLHGSAGAAVSGDDARALDAELRSLMAERQRHEAALAAHLRAVGSERRYRLDGLGSLEAYAREHFGLSPRRLYYLLALHRTLDLLPRLHDAFLSGRITMKQVLLIGSVATRVTESAWIRRAKGVTLRRLEDEVGFWRHLRGTRPRVWELLEGGPIPEGVSLVPGKSPRLHACASPAAVVFLHALEEEETTEPFPQRTCRIRMRVEPYIKMMWEETIARCRAVAGIKLKDWEVLALVLHDFWKTWDNSETRRQRRENPTLERDGWRCMAPGCRSMGTGRLQEHHVRFRSACGSNDPSNLISLCVGHHLGLLHEGHMRCSGRAPDDLTWEMGTELGKKPFEVFRGDLRIAL